MQWAVGPYKRGLPTGQAPYYYSCCVALTFLISFGQALYDDYCYSYHRAYLLAMTCLFSLSISQNKPLPPDSPQFCSLRVKLRSYYGPYPVSHESLIITVGVLIKHSPMVADFGAGLDLEYQAILGPTHSLLGQVPQKGHERLVKAQFIWCSNSERKVPVPT